MRRLSLVIAVLFITHAGVAAQREFDDTRTFSAAEGKVIVVDVKDHDVTLRTADVLELTLVTELKIQGVGEKRAEEWIAAHMPEIEDGPSRLTISAGSARAGWFGVAGLFSRERLSLTIPLTVIPDITTTGGTVRLFGDFGQAQPLKLRSATGDLILTGAVSSIDAHTNAGSVELEVIRPLESLFARTASGRVSLKGGARSSEVDTSSGDVRLENLSGSVKVTTSGGRVDLIFDRLDADARVKVHTDNGRVRIVLPADVKPRGQLRSPKGAIKSDFPGTVADSQDLVDLVGDGPVLDIETVSGDIQILAEDPWQPIAKRETLLDR